MASPLTHENTLRTHDQAIYDWLADLRVDYSTTQEWFDARLGVYPWLERMRASKTTVPTESRRQHPILRVVAKRQRAFAAVLDMLMAQGWFDASMIEAIRSGADNDWSILPWPIAVIDPQPAIPDQTKNRTSHLNWLKEVNLDDGGVSYISHPSVWERIYIVTFFADKVFTENHIREWKMAKFGQEGTEGKTHVTVNHRAPIGPQTHVMSWIGTQDLSIAEGAGPRVISFTFELSLPVLFFRAERRNAPEDPNPSANGYPPARRISVPTFIPQPDGITNYLCETTVGQLDLHPSRVSPSLFRIPNPLPRIWPVMGTALVTRSPLSPDGRPPTGIRIFVSTFVDVVHLWSARIGLTEAPNYGVFALAVTYRATLPITLAFDQRALTTDPWVSARRAVLPATSAWRTVEIHVVLTQEIVSVSLEGSGAAFAMADIASVSIREVLFGTLREPLVTPDYFAFLDLQASKTYLVSAVAPAPASGLAQVREDLDDPENTIKRQMVSENGFAEILSPRNRSISVSLPFVPTAIHIQEYGAALVGRL